MAARADADNISLESSSSFASTSNDTMVVGFADGFIESEDSHLLRDLTVSRIGGIPVRLFNPSAPASGGGADR